MAMTPNAKGLKSRVGYVRISDDPMGREAGVRRQEKEQRELAANRGFELAHVYRDNDLSATAGKRRPAYQQLMASVARGEIDVIVVYHLSRLLRNRRERADAIELFRQHRIKVICVRGPEIDCSTATGRAMFGLLGEFDTMEVEIKAERQQSERKQAREDGRTQVAKRLFGYEHGHGALVEEEAQAVRDAFDRVLSGGSVKGIARMLNDRGLKTPMPQLDENGNVKTTGQPPRRGGREWTLGKVHGLLRNPRYCGLQIYEEVDDDGRAQTVEYAGAWPKVIEPEVWRAVQAILDDPDRFHGLPLARRWLGSGLFQCGACTVDGRQQGMLSTYRSRPTGQVRIYKCPTAHLSVRAELVDEFVVDLIVERLSRNDAKDLLVNDDRPDVAGLRQEAEALRVRIRELGELFDEGEIGKAEYKDRKARMQTKLLGLEEQTQHADRSPILADLIGAGDVRARWEQLDLERQRQVVDLLCTVTLFSQGSGRRSFDPEKIVIVPKRL